MAFSFSVLAGCAPSSAVSGVKLNKTSLEMKVGAEATLVATVSPSTAENKKVSWSSSAEDVATVSAQGKVTALEEGSAVITVTTEEGSFTATCAVTVKADSSQDGSDYEFPEFESELAEQNAVRALDLFKQAYSDFYIPESKYVYAYLGDTKAGGDWHLVALLEAAITLMDLLPDNEYLEEAAASMFEAMDYFREQRTDGYLLYGTERGLVPGGAPIKTAFDDNAHIARVYMEAYRVTKDIRYLEYAEELMRSIIDLSWHYQINTITGKEIGGFGWGEGDVINYLPTCMNAPAAVMFAEMYQLINDYSEELEGKMQQTAQYYLDWAIKSYDWTQTYLRFPDGVYCDARSCTELEDGSYAITEIGGTAHTYNSGFPISASALLYEITGEEKYLADAKFTAAAAFDEFADGSYAEGLYQYPQKYPEAGNWFHQILLEGYLYLDGTESNEDSLKFVNSFQNGLDYAYEHYYRDGYIPTNYITGWIPYGEDDQNLAVLSVSANIVMYAKLAAHWEKGAVAE